MNYYLVEGSVIIKNYVTGYSSCRNVSNLVMASSESEAEYKFAEHYEDKLSTGSDETYRVDWCIVKPTII